MITMKESKSASPQLDILQDIFIFLLLNASVPQQTVRKIVRVELARVTRIGKLLNTSRRQKQS
jgi:hypothetical protein